MDHHQYTQKDVEHIMASCQEQGIAIIVTTQKDAVKLRHFGAIVPEHIRILALKIMIDMVHGKDAFFERITHLL